MEDKTKQVPNSRKLLLLGAEWVVAISATLTGVAMHYRFMRHAGGLWRDEAGAVNLAAMPGLSNVWHWLIYDSFPLFWLMVLRVWTSLGFGSDEGLRMLGFLTGVAFLGTLWLNARWLKIRLPLLTLLLLGFSPVFIVFGDSMRAWGWGACFILLVFGLVWRVVEKTTCLNVLLAAVGAIASAQTTYHNCVLLVAICGGGMAVAIQRRDGLLGSRIAFILAAAGVSMIPYWRILFQGGEHYSELRVIYGMAQFWERLPEAISGTGFFGFEVIRPVVWGALFVICLGMAMVCLSEDLKGKLSPSQRELQLFALSVMVTAPLGFFVFLKHLGFFTQAWYYMALLAVEGLAMEAILSVSGNWLFLRIIRVVCITALMGEVVMPVFHSVAVRMTNEDLIAQELGVASKPNDLIVLVRWYLGTSFGRYYSGAAPWVTVPQMNDHAVHRYDLEKELLQCPDQSAVLAPVLVKIKKELKAGGRVWVVNSGALPEINPPRLPRVPDPLKNKKVRAKSTAPPPGIGEQPRNAYYQLYWESEVQGFIQLHSEKITETIVSAKASINPFETTRLFMAEGWRDD